MAGTAKDKGAKGKWEDFRVHNERRDRRDFYCGACALCELRCLGQAAAVVSRLGGFLSARRSWGIQGSVCGSAPVAR